MNNTIKDIAKLANVSHSTVSRALNDSNLVKQATKVTIKKIAKQLNYFPDFNAKSLVLNKSYNIALVFPSISHEILPSFFHDVIDGVSSVINDKYNLIIIGIDDYRDCRAINKNSFSGIILVSESCKDDVFIHDIFLKKIPIVVLNRKIKNIPIVNLLSDDKEGSFKAANYLIKNGHTKIAIIDGEKNYKSSLSRKEGFLRALINKKIKIYDEYIMKGKYSMESGYCEMKKLLALSNLPTAVFCTNDVIAVGAIKAIFENGKRVPDDISIIGFGNSYIDKYVTPELTSVKIPIKEYGIKGAYYLLKLIDGESISGIKVYSDSNLVIRNSVKKLN